ncbi:MAG: hypothetical protein AABZ53_14720 [Planctomycetota bacterium]
MPRFSDYHRTVIGYHGTRLSVARQIVDLTGSFQKSSNPHDWLGTGVYFWEYAPKQAWLWAEQLRKSRKWTEPTAVVASMIRLGNCFDLLDPDNITELEWHYQQFARMVTGAGGKTPKNHNTKKYLDRAVFEFAYAAHKDQGEPVDTCRAVYVPTSTALDGKNARVWTRSWITRTSHIQLCVRDLSCILGSWLVKPIEKPDAKSTHQQS